MIYAMARSDFNWWYLSALLQHVLLQFGNSYPFKSQNINKILVNQLNKCHFLSSMICKKSENNLFIIFLQRYIITFLNINSKPMSGNRNMAQYSDFEGRTNIKVHHAPGGNSSLSLGWSQQKTDYGPPRQIRRSREKQQYTRNSQTNIRNDKYMPPQQYDHGYDQGRYQPQGYQKPSENYQNAHQQPPNYPPKQPQNNFQYRNVVEHRPINELVKGPNNSYEQNGQQISKYYKMPDTIDRAIQQHSKNLQYQRKPPSQPKTQGRSCIKINQGPKQQFFIGDNNYNYWKDTSQGKNPNNNSFSSKKVISSEPNQYSNQQTEKTSIKVHNPPGGKSNFIFG